MRVVAVHVGRAVPYTRPGTRSAIDKRAVDGPVGVGTLGLDGDEQGDPRVHGGPDKAVHLYATAHHATWNEELPPGARRAGPGAFGENLAVEGLDERGVCLGDRWRVGTAVIEVSQARLPCWKLDDRFGVPGMAARVQVSRRTGWYGRVLDPGVVAAGDALERMARPHPDWPLLRLLDLVFDGVADDRLREALALPLTPSWRRTFERRLATGTVEDQAPRLVGPLPSAD